MKRRNFLKTCGVTSASLFLLNDTFAAVSSEYKRNPNIKPIMGSWFEFTHGFAPEGKYWNPVLPQFTEQQWKEKVKEISEAGMEYLVLMAVANDGKTFYPSKLQPRYDYVCADPLEAILSAADECGIKFFVSNDFWSDWHDGNKMMSDAEVAKLREKGMEEVAEKYSHHKSFYGWYYPNESGLWNSIDEMTINYV
ncbi:MAG: DUF4434 domain-containing protein, partial [Bacteroidota bacterium]|nr:DUF4434 domain-containing protein [Bacteroidota bacterium]